jgi:hypothetical protein
MTTPVVTPEVEKKESEPKRATPVKKAVAKQKAARHKAAKLSNIPAKRAKNSAKNVRRKVKATKRRPFPYERVAKLWEKGKTLTEISKALGIFNIKSDDSNHRLRVALTGMHKGWRDSKGKLHKLPHRVKKSSLAASRRAGKKAAA